MSSRAEQTRIRLLTAALRLFGERGYDAVGTAEIAAEAGVTEMTLFRHFPSKASLLVDDPYDPAIAVAIREQPRSVDPVARAARGVRAAWREIPAPDSEDVRIRLRIVAQTPSLRSSLAAGTAASTEAITEALVAGGTERRDAAVAAGAVMGALNAALLEWSLTEDGGLGDAIESALDLLENRHG
ncbi:helix-turn-helix domain-containing protein [Kribbella sancticallisti]|uniref:TetR/AcrR family transcriptional regulator n=1 Tax=Kribbella sancticallisti TaxID=460087 RepID=UPI0031E3EEC0